MAEQRSQPFKTATGDVVIPLAPNRRYQVSMLDRRSLRSIKANACGFVRMPSDSLGEKPLLPTTAGGVARFAIADLPTGEQILCQRKEFYKPASFPPPLATAMSNQTIVDDGGSPPITPPALSQNTPPTIGEIPNQSIDWQTSNPKTISFTVSDAQTAPESLTVSVGSFDTNIFESVVLGGSGTNRTITIRAKNVITFEAPIAINVSDGSLTASKTFGVTVAGYSMSGGSGLPSKAYVTESGKLEITNLTPNTFYTLYYEGATTIRTNSCGRLIAWGWWANEVNLFSGTSVNDDWSNLIRYYTQDDGLEYGNAPPCS